MESKDKLNSLIRSNISDEGETQMSQSQPLQEIRTDNEMFEPLSSAMKEFDEKAREMVNNVSERFSKVKGILPNINTVEKFNEFEDGCEMICDQCQIKDIIGNCRGCGLYQYGELFEVQTRRRL